MANVRQKSGTPTAEDFRSPDGTPVVVDAAAGIAYIIKTDNSIVAIGPYTGGSGIAITASGGSVSSGTLVFSNGSGVTFGIAGQTLTASVAAGVPSPVNISAGTTSNNLASVVFSNSNGVSFGLNGSTITGTVATNYQSQGAYLTTAMLSNAATISNINVSGGTTSNNLSNVVFSNSNGISFGLNGSTMTGSHNAITTGMASNRGSDFVQATAAFAGTSASGTINSTGISVSIGPYITTGALSNHSHGVSFTSGSVAFQTLSFTNSNGISFNSGTQGIFGSHNAITTGRASTDAVGLNTAQTNVTWTVNSSGISLNAGAYLTTAAISNHSHGVSFTSGSVGFQTLSFTNSNGISFNSGTQGIFGSHNAITTGALSDHSHGNPTLNLTNLSGTTASASNGFTLSLSAAAAGAALINFSAGTTSSNIGSVVFSNSNGVSFGLNGSTITASAAGGAGGATISRFFNMLGEPVAGTTSLTAGGSSVFVEPVLMPSHVSMSYLRFPISVGFGSSTFASTANTTVSLNQSCTQFFCIYSQGVGASSRSLQSIYSSSVSLRLNVVYLVGAASGNQSVSHAITYPVTGNSSATFSTSYAPAASSILRVSTTHLTAFTGAVFMDIPIATLMTPGNYWIAFQSSSATAVTGVAGMSNLTSRASYIALSQISSNIRELGANTTAGSNMWFGYGHGWWTTNTNGATTASMALSHISTIANQPIIPFMMDRFA